MVKYHTWARRQDDDAVAKLRKLRDTVRRWEGSISPDHMSARRKASLPCFKDIFITEILFFGILQTAEIIALLYEATQGPPLPLESPALNPTGGVTGKPPIDLDYKKDPTRPGGGVFIVRGQVAQNENLKDVPVGVIISSTSESRMDSGEGGSVPGPSSISAPPTAVSGRDDTSALFASSSFAPPLPNETSTTSRPTVTPLYNGSGIPSAVRSTANDQQRPTSQPTSPMVNLTPIGRQSDGYMNVNPAMNVQGKTIQVMNVLDGAPSGNNLQEFASADNGFLEGIPGGMFDWGESVVSNVAKKW